MAFVTMGANAMAVMRFRFGRMSDEQVIKHGTAVILDPARPQD